MALSNLRNEPRREIIEQVAGTVLVIGIIAADYCVVRFLLQQEKPIDIFLGMMITPIFGVFLGMFVYMLFHVTHAIGEMVCARLGRFGIDPRPTQRYRR